MRRFVVGAIGSNGNFPAGYNFGAAVVQHDWILLTGGQVYSVAVVQVKGALKDAAMVGADQNLGPNARLIGILPIDASPNGVSLSGYAHGKQLFLQTGLSSQERNVINGQTPDVVVVFPGGRGTIAELAFALMAGRRLIFAPGSLSSLTTRLSQEYGYGSDHPSPQQLCNRADYLTKPAGLFGFPLPNAQGVINQVASCLSQASASLNLQGDVKHFAPTSGWLRDSTGFPGLPGSPNSKTQFENIVMKIS